MIRQSHFEHRQETVCFLVIFVDSAIRSFTCMMIEASAKDSNIAPKSDNAQIISLEDWLY